MTIQSLPTFYNFQYTDKNGNMTSDSLLFNDQTFQVLNIVVNLLNKITSTTINGGTVTVNGLIVPVLSSPPSSPAIGQIWYNSSIGSGKLQFQTSAGIETITST